MHSKKGTEQHERNGLLFITHSLFLEMLVRPRGSSCQCVCIHAISDDWRILSSNRRAQHPGLVFPLKPVTLYQCLVSAGPACYSTGLKRLKGLRPLGGSLGGDRSSSNAAYKCQTAQHHTEDMSKEHNLHPTDNRVEWAWPAPHG